MSTKLRYNLLSQSQIKKMQSPKHHNRGNSQVVSRPKTKREMKAPPKTQRRPPKSNKHDVSNSMHKSTWFESSQIEN